jgi:U3 small nucleolar RNA-associated protein 25
VTRARGDFFHGRARVMLTTERFHFFFRYKLRGIRRVVFYAPPSYGHFYSEMLNLVEVNDGGSKKSTSKSSSLGLYTAGDALTLESVVGSAHAAGMLAAEDPSQVFSYA